MNNKGFAITTILYGTLILFLMLLLSLLGILTSYKDRLSILIDKTGAARTHIMSARFERPEPPIVLYGVCSVYEYTWDGVKRSGYLSIENNDKESCVEKEAEGKVDYSWDRDDLPIRWDCGDMVCEVISCTIDSELLEIFNGYNPMGCTSRD